MYLLTNWPLIIGLTGLSIMLIYYTFFSISVERQLDKIYKYFSEQNIEVLYIDTKKGIYGRTVNVYKVATDNGEYLLEMKKLKIMFSIKA